MNKYFLLMATAICILLLGSCNDDDDAISDFESVSAKQVDMTVVVPIHPSSLEYFDYVIRYDDNQGVENKDTIQEASDETFAKGRAKKASLVNDCYIRTFSYDNMHVSCVTSVEMIPKADYEILDSFSFYIPKPYIFPIVRNSTKSDIDWNFNGLPEGVESIWIDSMLLSDFLTTYGTLFSSQCVINNDMVGYEIFFY